ncbi:MAG: pyridoxamine 5'-phosphate oxidase family protein [Paludibacteraceae bacterium]|nr:pyridoxamine 5'-phosphate oxidase family protein [Paludibacteraceae bacterium]
MRTFFITDQEEIDQIILSCEHCFVGISEKDGSPYVFPMNFAYADGVIILHSGPHGKHLQLLETDNRVCVTFCTENNKILYQHPDVACSYSMQSKSVLCKGKIEFVENQEEKERLIKLFMRHYTDREFKISAPAIRNVKVWIMKPETITAKAFGQNFKYG